ncbi:MAG: hypothetical protein PWQ10_646 [Patescibacteria group bacterium]|nr:hypothetical protein [Patescibacteria group bacterium]
MEYMTTLKKCQEKVDWDDYVLEHKGHPLQLWGWGNVKSTHGWEACRLFLDDGDNIIGAVQILIRRLPWPLKSICYVPRGPVVSDDNREDLLLKLEAYVKRVYHSVVISIEPDYAGKYIVPSGWSRVSNHILPARTIILDLNKPESELMNDMVKKTRQYIRKSTAEAITIKVVRSREELTECLKIYQETSKRAKFELHNEQYYYDVFNQLGDHSPVFAAYVDNHPIAFLWLAISADTAYELYGGMDKLGQQLRSNYALKWYAIRKCKEWGLSRYDFGGLLEGGVTTFKKGWASEEVELVGTFDRPLSAFYSLWSNGLPIAKVVIRKIKSLFRKK